MCSPTAIIQGGMGLFSVFQQNQQIDASNEAAKIQQQVEQRRADQEAMDRQNQLTQDAQIEAQKLNQARQATALSELRAQSSATVSSAESGLGGVSSIRSFIANETAGALAEGDLNTQQAATQFNLQQKARGITTARSTRTENAFLTRQANTRRKLGVVDFAVGALGNEAAGKAIADQF